MKLLLKISKFIFTAAFFLVIISCSGEAVFIPGVYLDGKYDAKYPYNESAKYLSEITKSVKLINSLAFYNQYQFYWKQNISLDSLQNRALLSKAYSKTTSSKSASGTGTIVGLNAQKILFLTNAHIVSFTDTLISYYSNERGQLTNIIESISIKQSQSVYVALVGLSSLEIVMLDKAKDIAFVGGSIKNTYPRDFSLFNYKAGDSRELEWGDFVYVFGYPMHFKMITQGLVSLPEDDENYFITDISVNRGSSGGPVLAIRDGVPNFELVGIVSSMPAEKLSILSPKPLMNNNRYRLDAKYDGDLYINELENTKYGIAKVISIQAIKKSIEENKTMLINCGYEINVFNDILHQN